MNDASFFYQTRLRCLFRGVFLLGLAAITGFLLIYDYKIITTPFQLEFREGSILATTGQLLAGQNPYAVASQPLSTNVYGVIYNFAVLPLAGSAGNTLAVHRLLTGACIFLSAVLLAFTTTRKGVPAAYAFAAGALFLCCQFFYMNALARPDGLGGLLFLLSVLVPWYRNYDWKSLAAGGLAGILAFYTKPYFILGLAYLAVYLLLFVSKKKVLVFGSLVFASFLASALLVWRAAPYYFLDVGYLHYYHASKNWVFMLVQLTQFFALFGLILGWIGIVAWREHTAQTKSPAAKTSRPHSRPARLNLRRLDEPLLSFFMDLPAFCFLLSTLLVIFSFGQHMGNYMVYLFQLMTPFFAILLMQALARHPHLSLVSYPVILANAILIVKILYPLGLGYDPQEYLMGWNRAREVITQYDFIYNSPAVVAEFLSAGKPLTNSGQNEYFYVSRVPDLFFLPEAGQVEKIGGGFRDTILQAIQHQTYEVVLFTPSDPFLTGLVDFEEYYQLSETIYLDMPVSRQKWEVGIWVPKQRQ